VGTELGPVDRVGPIWVATGRAEPLVATVLCAGLLALLALDLQRLGGDWAGNPTAIVVPVALIAGWTLRTHWAAPVWALCAAACVAAVATGGLPPLNVAVIAFGTLAAGSVGHAGSAVYRESLGVLQRSRRSLDETARQLHMAVEAAIDVGFETELDQVTMRLLARSAQMVGADRGSIGRMDDGQLIVEANWPGVEQPPGATARTMSLVGVPGLLETLRSGRHLQHSTRGTDGAPARHSLQYPLMAGGELVGVMTLSRTAEEPFGEAQLRGLQQLTSLTALTLRSARLLLQARSLGRAKSEFLNMAAHELRTPLAVVRGYLSMMADGTLDVPDTTRSTVVNVLCQKTDELSVMVDQILTAAQLQAGHVELKREVFDLRAAIGEVLERHRVRAQQAGAELWCHPLGDPIQVEAVQTSVVRILDNLVANAIAYGSGLPVRLTVEAGDMVLVRVEDQGIGMSQEQQARLFEPFFRVDQPAVGSHAGAGLGLAVSRRLAEFSGGSLELEWTQEDAGSTFVLRLPAAVGTAAP
jgi:signal transduction histidine kinase